MQKIDNNTDSMNSQAPIEEGFSRIFSQRKDNLNSEASASLKSQAQDELRRLLSNDKVLEQTALSLFDDPNVSKQDLQKVKTALRNVIEDVLSGTIKFDVFLAKTGNLTTRSGNYVLPKRVAGAFDSQSNSILISRDTLRAGGDTLSSVIQEEVGELLAAELLKQIEAALGEEAAKKLGLSLTGDVGARVQTILSGGNMRDIDQGLYISQASDQGQAVVGGKATDVKFRFIPKLPKPSFTPDIPTIKVPDLDIPNITVLGGTGLDIPAPKLATPDLPTPKVTKPDTTVTSTPRRPGISPDGTLSPPQTKSFVPDDTPAPRRPDIEDVPDGTAQVISEKDLQGAMRGGAIRTVGDQPYIYKGGGVPKGYDVVTMQTIIGPDINVIGQFRKIEGTNQTVFIIRNPKTNEAIGILTKQDGAWVKIDHLEGGGPPPHQSHRCPNKRHPCSVCTARTEQYNKSYRRKIPG